MAIIAINGKIGSGKDLTGKIIQILTCFPKISNERLIKDLNKSYDNYNFQIKKFADKLKDNLCSLLACTRIQLEDREFKEKELTEEWWYWETNNVFGKINYLDNKDLFQSIPLAKLIKPTPRLLLQLLGTEYGRNIIHPNIWVNSLMSEYKIEIIPNENYGSNKTQPKNWIITKEYEHEYELDNSHLVYKDEVNVIVPQWIITDLRFPNELKAVKSKNGITIRISRGKPQLYEQMNGTIENPIPTGVFKEHESEIALDNAQFDYEIDNNGTIEELIEKVKEILIKEQII